MRPFADYVKKSTGYQELSYALASAKKRCYDSQVFISKECAELILAEYKSRKPKKSNHHKNVK